MLFYYFAGRHHTEESTSFVGHCVAFIAFKRIRSLLFLAVSRNSILLHLNPLYPLTPCSMTAYHPCPLT